MDPLLDPVGGMADLRVSKVAPAVEDSIVKLHELVKQAGRSHGSLTESQNRRMVAYLGNLEEMRSQIVIMIQRYEHDEKVLKRLLDLCDRVDEVRSLTAAAHQGFDDAENDGADSKYEGDASRYNTPSNPLMVSAMNMLGASGLLLKRLYGEEEEQYDGDDDDESDSEDQWDKPLTEEELRLLDTTETTTPAAPINLSMSVIMTDETHSSNNANSLSVSTPVQQASQDIQEGESSKKKGKGKGKKDSNHLRKACPPTLCKICYDEYNTWDVLYEVSPCGHIYCKECLRGYLSMNISEGAVLDLMCPCPDCETEIQPVDVEALCDEVTISKYEKFTIIAALRADPNVRWCPVPDCDNAIRADPNQPWVDCDKCSFQFCFKCGEERHDGANCGREAFELLKQRREKWQEAHNLFSEWYEEQKVRVKPCPKCHSYIEKNQGCNHMTCGNPSCKQQFCWLCLSLYTQDHFNNAGQYPECLGKQYYLPPVPNTPVDPDLAARYPIYFPPTYQYADIDGSPVAARQRPPNYRKIAKKVGMYVGIGMAVVTLGVPAAVIGGPVYGCFKLHKRLKAKRRQSRYAMEQPL